MQNKLTQINAKDNKDNYPSSKWVLILDWPGLDKIYPVRVTRSVNESTIKMQFHDHALPCPSCMDKVIYSLKHRTLGYDADYDFLLQTVVRYLQSPDSFSVLEWVSFEDFILIEYCSHLLDNYFNANVDTFQHQSNADDLKASILQDFRSKRKKRIEEECYLKITFSEDILRSRSEIIMLTEEKESIWRTNKKLSFYKH